MCDDDSMRLSEEERYLAGCAGKEAFDDRSLAVRVAKRKPGRTAYRCDHCHKWHVGRPKKKARNERTRQR